MRTIASWLSLAGASVTVPGSHGSIEGLGVGTSPHANGRTAQRPAEFIDQHTGIPGLRLRLSLTAAG